MCFYANIACAGWVYTSFCGCLSSNRRTECNWQLTSLNDVFIALEKNTRFWFWLQFSFQNSLRRINAKTCVILQFLWHPDYFVKSRAVVKALSPSYESSCKSETPQLVCHNTCLSHLTWKISVMVFFAVPIAGVYLVSVFRLWDLWGRKLQIYLFVFIG